MQVFFKRCIDSLALNTWEKILYPVLLLLSYFTYAAYYYKELNSDHAIHVLMAQDFNSYKDLYYWGQNRLGSLIPLLAHLLTFIMHPLHAVSLVQYVIILGVAFWLLYWVKSPLWRLALILVWLFPSFHWACQILIAHSYSGQFFFLLTAFSLLTPRFNRPYLSIISLFLAFWCSELSVAALPAWLFLYFKYLKNKGLLFQWKKIIRLSTALFLIFSTGVIGLLAVKNQLPDDKSYLKKTFVEDAQMLRENIEISISHYIKTFGHNELVPALNVIRILALIWLLAFIMATIWALFFLKRNTWGQDHVWASVLWITIALLMVSRYFHIMGSSNHYMSLAPIISLFVLAIFEGKGFVKIKKYLIFILLPIITVLAAHHLYFFQKIPPYQDSYRLSRETVKDFPLGNEPIGVVGNYWTSYIFGAYHPEKVAPTPYWGDYIRNWQLYEKAMNRPVIAIGKGWMQPMQDSIYMGKYYLIRTGEIKTHKDTEYAEYQSFKTENENQ